LPEESPAGKVRINRALAQAGVASRRKAEQLVLDGRVTVNGRKLDDLATYVDPVRDVIAVDGLRIAQSAPVYYIYNKPRGEISTVRDERGRKCVGDLCRGLAGSPQPVGRLDRRSEGLMLLTNDGDTAQRLAHPRHQVHKEYQVTVKPVLLDQDARQMTSAVELEDGPARFLSMELTGQEQGASRLVVVVDEGRNRLVRRVFEHFTYRVALLRRVSLGPLRLGRLKPGEYRQLSAAEAADLRRQLGLKK
jgi:23S rRNA pseudouridine2605 synthase